ncbi:MAG: 50S ribosome-binding GTPase [Holophagaceae bacterium]|nr:50S ribosome-binding GTPase [Holophagaceae bacterium]
MSGLQALNANLPVSGLPAVDRGVLRFLTCGSVDDGKSTLIGRLLYDSRAILADALHALEASSRKRGLAGIDLSLLTDGLSAEREQGITIDVAYRYFSTGTRKFIIADAPGHAQYTRNMVTAASTADLALILVDARKGVQEQTRRHAALAHLLGIRNLVFVVNKLDLVGYDPRVFEALQGELEAFSRSLGVARPAFVPISALVGYMVVSRGSHLDWYQGPTLLELLEAAQADRSQAGRPFRFPVQLVCRPRTAGQAEFRGYQGRITSGAVAVGDPVRVLPAGHTTRVAGLRLLDAKLSHAVAGQSVTLLLEDELDISRGDLLASVVAPPARALDLEATLCWLSERPFDPARPLRLRHTTREVKARITDLAGRLDLRSLALEPAAGLKANDIAEVRLRLQAPVFVDPYRADRATGAFVLVDEASHDTVAAGLVRAVPGGRP